MSDQQKILSFGSLNIDRVYSVCDMVRSGETISALALDFFPGGKGLNTSIALRRAGAHVWMAGGVGEEDGHALLDALVQSGVNIDLIERRSMPSGHAVIQVDSKGENCIIVYGGANMENTNAYILDVLSHFSEGDYILLQNEINGLSMIMEEAFRRGMNIVLNPSPMNESILQLDLRLVSCFMLNEHEAYELCNERDVHKQLDVLRTRYPKATVVITKGVEGSYCASPDSDVLHQPAFLTNTVDTTAAGDTFTGYFVSAIARGASNKEALELASAASSITVSRAGASSSIPQLKDVQTLLAKTGIS